MDESIKPTEAELEFLRLKREQDELQKQQDALKEQLEKDKEMRRQQERLQDKISENEQSNIRIKAYYQTLCDNGCSNYIKLENEPILIKSSDYVEDPLIFGGARYVIKIGSNSIYSVTSDNKAECSSVTGSYREYLATGMAKKILGKIAENAQKKAAENKLEQAKRDLTIYFTETSPEGTVITTRQEYESHYSGYNRKQGGYYINLIKLEYPNKSWVDVKYWEDGNWNIYKKFDSHVPKFDTKEEWLNYLMS